MSYVCVGLRVSNSVSNYHHLPSILATSIRPVQSKIRLKQGGKLKSTEVQLILFTNLYSILFSTNKQIDRIL